MNSNDGDKIPNHYQMDGELHWNRQWRLYGRAYFVGQITKYAERYHKKGGLRDLQKMIHFGQKLYELEEAARNGTGPLGGSNGVEGQQPIVPLSIEDEIEKKAKPKRSDLLPPSTENVVVDNHGFGHVEDDNGQEVS